jgi:beta-catenin-like protein 1
MPNAPTPEMLKRMRLDSEDAVEAPPPVSEAPKTRKAYVRTEEEEENEARERGEVAPGGDTDHFVEEDEEGRFYGGGLTSQQKDIMNIFDQVTGEGAQDDVSSVIDVQTALTFVLISDVRLIA